VPYFQSHVTNETSNAGDRPWPIAVISAIPKLFDHRSTRHVPGRFLVLPPFALSASDSPGMESGAPPKASELKSSRFVAAFENGALKSIGQHVPYKYP